MGPGVGCSKDRAVIGRDLGGVFERSGEEGTMPLDDVEGSCKPAPT